MAMNALSGSFGRLELKYLIGERTAARIRRQIAPYCRNDEHSFESPTRRGYPVRSLYLDTPSLAFHRAKEQGLPERFKLRVRSYRDGEFWLEHKQRSADIVRKARAHFHGKAVRDAALGEAKVAGDDASGRRLRDRFARMVCETGAHPTVLIRYDREAFVSEVDSYARVTFDRNIEFQRTDRWALDADERRWDPLDRHFRPETPRPPVVMEIKCELAVPGWLVDTVRRNDLRRVSISKYSLGIYASRRIESREPMSERARGILR
jgi:hypothetical protein